MKFKIISFAISVIFYTALHSQTCPNETNIANTNVCGYYGDASGNSNWNWEINDPLNSNYCRNWYARTSPTGFLTLMGSPFVNAASGKLKIIADNSDYLKSKGWELLQRKFGCLSEITNPYFILYNKFSGMLRVYVYINGNPQGYSKILMTIKSVYDQRPAILSSGDTGLLAPDKYLANQAGTSGNDILLSLNESVGSNNWAVGEFDIMLDQNIANAAYSNGSIEITVYGVTNSTLEAIIQGTSVSAGTLQDAVIKAKNVSTGGASFNFTAQGEKLLKLSKEISGLVSLVHKNSDSVYSKLKNSPDSLLRKISRIAKDVNNNTGNTTDFGKLFIGIGTFLGIPGNALKFIGAVNGLFNNSSTTPAATPTYTTYNLTVSGQISSQIVVEKFVLKIPATSAIPTNANNATYYNCPLGVFNLATTPKVDTLAYDRRALLPNNINPGGGVPRTIRYAAYRLHDDPVVVVNAGAGMSVISVEGALVGKVVLRPQDNADPNFTVWLDPFEKNPERGFYTYFNHMRADIEANRLEFTHYDVDGGGYNIIQTPFYKLECIKSASININIPVLKVYLRIRATLKRTDGQGELVYFVKDYELDKIAGDPGAIPLDISTNVNAIPPYANYTIAPNSQSSVHDIVFSTVADVTLSTPIEVIGNSSIQNSSDHYTTINNTIPNVIWRAGGYVTLNPKFTAEAGSIFLATVDFGYAPQQCISAPIITQFTNSGSCYVNNIIAQKQVYTFNQEKDNLNRVNVYPNPASNYIYIEADQAKNIKNVIAFDVAGRKYHLRWELQTDKYLKLDISKLNNGTYTLQLNADRNFKVYKFVVIKNSL